MSWSTRAGRPALVFGMLAGLIGGCSGTSTLPSLFTTSSTPAPAAPPAPPAPQWALVAMRPAAGTSPEYAQMLTREINDRLKTREVALLVDPNARADTTLAGYFAVHSKKGSMTIDYNWDVVEPNGTLRRRVAGSETIALKTPSANPWGAVPPATTALLADKAVEALGSDMPKSAITTSSIDKIETRPEKK